MIPRLFWFPKTTTPFEVLKEIVTQYSFVTSDEPATHDSKAYFEEHWKPLLDFLADPEKAGVVLDLSEFEQDSTEFPLTVNLRNPYYDSYKSSYFLPKCRNCGEQSCKNCPMPVNTHGTIWELVESMVSKKSFSDNAHLYKMNKEDIKRKQEAIEKGEDEAKHEEGAVIKPKKRKGLGLQDTSSSDEDNLIVDTTVSKPQNDDYARHLTFSLELVFVNRLVKRVSKDMLSMLVSYDGHPRDKKNAGAKK